MKGFFFPFNVPWKLHRGNINTLLCFARKGKAVPYSTPWRSTGYEARMIRAIFTVRVWFFGRIKCHDRSRAIMILLPSPRHRKDGSPHDGGGEMPMCAAKHSLYCFLYLCVFVSNCTLIKIHKIKWKKVSDQRWGFLLRYSKLKWEFFERIRVLTGVVCPLSEPRYGSNGTMNVNHSL